MMDRYNNNNQPTIQVTTSTSRADSNDGMLMEICTFVVPRNAKRVYRNLKLSDEWMPMFYNRGYDGKRIKKSKDNNINQQQGSTGVAYLSEYYEITTSFAKEKYQRYENNII